MDQSTREAARPAARREMMFCHECNDEWYRDEKGIICPECDSEFTEIIEEDNDPRDNFAHGHEDDDGDSLPSLEEAPPNSHPFANHNPWADVDDPDEADISQMRFQPVGPGRFHVQATIHRTVSPATFGAAGAGLNTMGAFQSFLTNLMQGAVAPQAQAQAQAQNQERERSQSQGVDGQSESRQAARGEPQVHRFSYSSSARLHPRDADHPGPRLEPVDDLNNVMAGLLAMIGDPPGVRAGPGQAHMPPNPLMGLFAAISGGQHGDAVYSQEALDRIISQLMEQNSASNAPGPASQQDIDALPRKQVTEEMLGAEHRAECSICMDEVNIGEQVTQLPCKHWFHHPCVAAWLGEHDTCPHCRKSIKGDGNSNSGNASGNANMNANINANDTSSGADPTASMPGSFGVAGEGTANDPWVVPGDSQNANRESPSNTANAQGGSNNEQGAGLGERIRRGLFGAQE